MILLHSFGHEQSLLSHNLSFLHPFHCYSHFLTSNHSLWLVCFTLLGWDLNYSALRRVNLARWPKERARKSIKLENAVFRKRKFESYWWGGDVRVIEGHYSYIQIDHHIFRLFFRWELEMKMKNRYFCELYTHWYLQSCLRIAIHISEGKLLAVIVVSTRLSHGATIFYLHIFMPNPPAKFLLLVWTRSSLSFVSSTCRVSFLLHF